MKTYIVTKNFVVSGSFKARNKKEAIKQLEDAYDDGSLVLAELGTFCEKESA